MGDISSHVLYLLFNMDLLAEGVLFIHEGIQLNFWVRRNKGIKIRCILQECPRPYTEHGKPLQNP